MLVAYRLGEGLEEVSIGGGDGIPPDTTWLDLFQPTAEEDDAAEKFLSLSIPTRADAEEIEFSSRFYTDEGGVFMTGSVLTGIEARHPMLVPFTIVVTERRVATVRYDDLRAVREFVARAMKPANGCITPPAVVVGLIEALVDRTADVVERLGKDVERLNKEVFSRHKKDDRRSNVQNRSWLAALISAIGIQGDLTGKARESLSSLERLIQYGALALPPAYATGSNRARLKLAARDIRSLEDHVTFLSQKIDFLQDATLGMAHAEQHDVIRVLTVAATVFFPPILIGTSYAMNFDFMPELNSPYGYPLAIVLMAASALGPFIYFKRRGWL